MIQVPKLLRQIDMGNVNLVERHDYCGWCGDEEGHTIKTCPEFKKYYDKYGDYTCPRCESINHHHKANCVRDRGVDAFRLIGILEDAPSWYWKANTH